MSTLIRSLSLTVLLSMPLCALGGEQPATSPGAAAAGAELTPSWREDRQALGKKTYERSCANCHDSGEQGAPRIRVKEDWSERSNMWQAILLPHAKAGYLEMPGKGGHPELSDEAVDAAAEYMLGETLPDLPKD